MLIGTSSIYETFHPPDFVSLVFDDMGSEVSAWDRVQFMDWWIKARRGVGNNALAGGVFRDRGVFCQHETVLHRRALAMYVSEPHRRMPLYSSKVCTCRFTLYGFDASISWPGFPDLGCIPLRDWEDGTVSLWILSSYFRQWTNRRSRGKKSVAMNDMLILSVIGR